jgi:general secretion pathway protein H
MVHPAPQTRGPPGFTLIELMVVLAIVAFLVVAVGPAVQSVTGANARAAAGELAGAMRYLFDTAALRHQTCRMALDLDGRAWSVECAPGAVAVAKEAEKAAEADKDLADRFSDEKDAERRRLLAKTAFGAFSDRLLPKRELPGKTRFGEIKVEGRRDPVTKGTAYVHFFANGQGQRALIPVIDGDTRYTVVVEPFTGRARVVNGVVEDDR